MKIRKKLLSILMTAALVLSLLPGLTLPAMAVTCGGFEVTGDSIYSFSGNTLTFSGDGTCVVKLASKWLATTNQIVVSGGTVNITLSDVIVNASGCAFTVANGATVNLTLSGTNALISCVSGNDGLQVASGATLTITSSTGGSLTATGCGGGAGGNGGAGIGGDGDISISGSAHVEATGGNGGDGNIGIGGDGGAGLGGDGDISISGSAYVEATGGNGGTGFNNGGGDGGDGGNGGAGIAGNTIGIYGSAQVTAYGSSGGAGGYSGSASNAGDGGDGAAGIDGGTIGIYDSVEVKAYGYYGGPGGSGDISGTGGNDADGIGSSGSSITISGGFVKATGAGTDTSYDINGNSLTITGGSVYPSYYKVNPLPTDGSNRVYFVYVTNMFYAANAATSYSINGGSTLSAKTDSVGLLYLWLPATESSTEILLNAGGKEYKASVDKISYENATDMFALDHLLATFVLTPCGNGAYFVESDGDSAYTGSYNDDSFLTLTVDSGVTGFQYFGVDITVAETGHAGTETCVFVQTRNGVQIAINATTADFDTLGTAKAGFNVKAGDVVTVYLVDSLSNSGSSTVL